MSNLFASLLSSSGALRAFDRSLATVQNNVTNASTPGYAKQRQVLNALEFQPERGLPGGVSAGERVSARDEYTERLVRDQQNEYGQAQQLKVSLSDMEPILDVTGQAGVPYALSQLFQSFSLLSVSPNDAVARQNVIDQAGQVARAFRTTAAGLEDASANAGRQIVSAVEGINRLAGLISDYNALIQRDVHNASDPSLDANIHATLEELSEAAGVQVLKQENGTYNLLLGGQTALVIGDRQFKIAADTGSSAQSRILDASGADVTAQVKTGRLGALLELKNDMIPNWLASLDTLASAVATKVNAQLQSGLDSQGNPGAALFTFQAATPARSLDVTAIDISQLAAAAAGAPGGNGNALVLAGMGSSAQVGPFTFTGAYADLAAKFGRELSNAQQRQATAQQLLAQARAMRQDESGVSLDEEAAQLIEFQRSYQAAARLITVLDELTQSVLNLIH